MSRRLLRPLLVALAALLSRPAVAQVVEAGGYRVNYAAINTMQLSPEVAARYGVQRAGDHALLLLNVSQGGKPVPASGRGSTRALTGHSDKLELRQVQIDGGYDLIARFKVLDGEFLFIEAQVLPVGGSQPIAIRFRQQFYRE